MIDSPFPQVQRWNRAKIRHVCNGRIRFHVPLLDNQSTHPLENALRQWTGIQEVRTNIYAKAVIIHYDRQKIDKQQILHFLNNSQDFPVTQKTRPFSLQKVFSASGSLLLSLMLPTGYAAFLTYLMVLPLIYSGSKKLISQGVNSHVLEAIAVIISLVRKEYISANITNLLLELSSYLEQSMEQKSNELLYSLASQKIETVWVIRETIESKIGFDEVQPADIVIVYTGDAIPVDGVIVSGEAYINESSMTGEVVPVFKQKGNRIISGTVITDGKIKIFAERVGNQTTVVKINDYIHNIISQKSNTEIESNQLAEKLVPINIVLGGISYAITSNWSSVASVFQADYSCAIKIAIPVAFKSTIYRLGNHGVLVKNSRAIENLAKTDTFIFDKTGTLTEGKLVIEEILYFDESEWNTESILSLVASIEEHYFHPVAEAIVIAARERSFRHFHHSEVEYLAGHGVYSYINDKKIVIGSKHFLQDHESISFDGVFQEQKYDKPGKTILYIGYDGRPFGIIILSDTLREQAAYTIQELKQYGISKIIMLTGDADQKAKEIADRLGIEEYYAEVTPEQKAKITRTLQEKGHKIAFVGDGINDAPALASVDVGISMGNSADVSRAASDIVLLKDELATLVETKQIADDCMKKIHRNFQFTVAANSTILGLAALGLSPAYITSILHNGTTVGMILNAMFGNGQQITKAINRHLQIESENVSQASSL